MPEPHSTHSRHLPSFVLGFADGLTVPFALTVGFASLGSSKLVILGGLAELFSGAISMGLGQYLAALTDRQHYQNELAREQREVEEVPEKEREEVYEILCAYGPGREAVRPFVEALCEEKGGWVRVSSLDEILVVLLSLGRSGKLC
jgi:vacuolar iron transporter family protein